VLHPIGPRQVAVLGLKQLDVLCVFDVHTNALGGQGQQHKLATDKDVFVELDLWPWGHVVGCLVSVVKESPLGQEATLFS
jgi:hypothetical protein